MKKYLILTFDICNMGGGQLFVLRRANYLKVKGFEVHIVVTFHTNYFPLEKEFRDFSIYVIPEMGKPYVSYSKSKADLLITGVLDKIGVCSELLVESHTLETIEWGELIASKSGAKHLAYPLAESRVSKYGFKPGKMIFRDKLKSNSFYGCTSTSLKQIFESDNVPSHYVNIGYSENEMYDKCQPLLKYIHKEDEYVITTITRLDKVYVVPLIESVANLARKYAQQKFVLLIAGGSKTKGREEFLFSNYNNQTYNLNNLNIVYTGYIEKLGRDIFSLTDVFVGMGTASINAISQRCLTINIDFSNMQYSSGFFGVDTNNFSYSENGKLYSILEKLEEAYLLSNEEIENRKLISRKLFEKEYEIDSCFRKLDQTFDDIESSQGNCKYEVSFFYRMLAQICIRLKKNCVVVLIILRNKIHSNIQMIKK